MRFLLLAFIFLGGLSTQANSGQEAAETPSVEQQVEGAKQMADAAKKKDKGAQMANIAAAMALLPACMAKPPNPMACAMMAMALMQAGKDSQNAGDAGLTSFSAAPVGGFDDSEFGTSSLGSEAENVRGGSGLTAGQERDLETAKSILAENGFSLDDNGNLSGPGGNIPSSALANPSSLSDFGLSSDDIEGAKKALGIAKDAASKYKDIALKSGGGGGGGSDGKSAPLPPLDFPEMGDFALKDHSNSLKKQVKGNRYAGFSRSLAGDRIGVAGDDIFNMVQRRYRAKKKARYFLP